MNEVDFMSEILFGNKEKISDALKSYVANEMQPLLALTTAIEAQLKLETLTNLLVAKGVITQEEIDAADALAEQSKAGLFVTEMTQKLAHLSDLMRKNDEK